MAQPGMARITCSECNAWYNTERELDDHKKMAHRKFGSDEGNSQHGGTQPDSSKLQRGPSKQE